LNTIIVGLGNILFSDDGVGLLVARALKSNVSEKYVAVVEAIVAGLDILDIITGFEKAIIVDAFQTGQFKPGTICRFDIDQISSFQERYPHSIDFLTSIKLGQKLGLVLPEKIILWGIEAENIAHLKEGCTPLVQAAIPICVDMILKELNTVERTGHQV
jgi:hydrogenase maturation protease